MRAASCEAMRSFVAAYRQVWYACWRWAHGRAYFLCSPVCGFCTSERSITTSLHARSRNQHNLTSPTLLALRKLLRVALLADGAAHAAQIENWHQIPGGTAGYCPCGISSWQSIDYKCRIPRHTTGKLFSARIIVPSKTGERVMGLYAPTNTL